MSPPLCGKDTIPMDGGEFGECPSTVVRTRILVCKGLSFRDGRS